MACCVSLHLDVRCVDVRVWVCPCALLLVLLVNNNNNYYYYYLLLLMNKLNE